MIYLIAGGVSLFGLFAYVLFMVFLPEWVGITGKTAEKNLRSHEGGSEDKDALSDFLDKS